VTLALSQNRGHHLGDISPKNRGQLGVKICSNRDLLEERQSQVTRLCNRERHHGFQEGRISS